MKKTEPQTIATSRGFKIGNQYRVISNEQGNSFYPEGTILEFVEDDGSDCPLFEYIFGPKGEYTDKIRQFYVNLDDLELVETKTESTKLDSKTLATILDFYVKDKYPYDEFLHQLVELL